MTSYAIGIDLGTTCSCVGVVKDGQVKIILNASGSTTTASCVAFTQWERLVGDVAKETGFVNSRNKVFHVKRLIGRKFNEETVQNDMKYWPFKVVNVDGRCRIQVEEKGKTKIYTPEELSAMVLTSMKETAEAYLRQEVEEAVITVPAYFNDSQRQATKDAAEIAGLKVLCIINESTAAGIAYALDEKMTNEQNILVYHLGSQTFDVTVMSEWDTETSGFGVHINIAIENGMFTLRSTSGDIHLGGEDFNSCLVDYCLSDIEERHKADISSNKRALRKLRTACETAIRMLLYTRQTTIEVDGLINGENFILDIDQSRFEELCFHLFRKTLGFVKKALVDAKMAKEQIDEIILVGGSSRMHGVQRLLRDYFDRKKLNQKVHPDNVVAYGAAIQAAILGGNKTDLVRNVENQDETHFQNLIDRLRTELENYNGD